MSQVVVVEQARSTADQNETRRIFTKSRSVLVLPSGINLSKIPLPEGEDQSPWRNLHDAVTNEQVRDVRTGEIVRA